eukprot:CAMPEP_0180639968 /NCGR_PEP_ID=MMETSP1037_2-20121125/45405_1 /TAXON_ID=632150 /ORGANISM="Azadinium spinosum, Strain 3D9" /LENGTH=689 /DNA_ID=CAMNT_0022662127 /DNA_START=8 /DNA_END=2074 /DNA_ORIENTATION=-
MRMMLLKGSDFGKMRLVDIIFGFYGIAHMFGCLWFFAKMHSPTGMGHEWDLWSGSAEVYTDPRASHMRGISIDAGSVQNLYICYTMAVRDGAVMLVGWGSPAASSPVELAIIVLLAPLSGLIMAYIHGVFVTAVTQARIEEERFSEQMALIRSTCDSMCLSDELTTRITHYIGYLSIHHMNANTLEILNQLNSNMTSEVRIFRMQDTIVKSELFTGVAARLVVLIVQVCQDRVFSLAVYIDESMTEKVSVLSEPAHFGEVCFLYTNVTRSAWIAMLTYGVLSRLDKAKFDAVLIDHPEGRDIILDNIQQQLKGRGGQRHSLKKSSLKNHGDENLRSSEKEMLNGMLRSSRPKRHSGLAPAPRKRSALRDERQDEQVPLMSDTEDDADSDVDEDAAGEQNEYLGRRGSAGCLQHLPLRASIGPLPSPRSTVHTGAGGSSLRAISAIQKMQQAAMSGQARNSEVMDSKVPTSKGDIEMAPVSSTSQAQSRSSLSVPTSAAQLSAAAEGLLQRQMAGLEARLRTQDEAIADLKRGQGSLQDTLSVQFAGMESRVMGALHSQAVLMTELGKASSVALPPSAAPGGPDVWQGAGPRKDEVTLTHLELWTDKLEATFKMHSTRLEARLGERDTNLARLVENVDVVRELIKVQLTSLETNVRELSTKHGALERAPHRQADLVEAPPGGSWLPSHLG